MNRRIATLWADALESREFRQTRGRLRSRRDGWCCLGVLCELYRRDTGRGEWVKDKSLWYSTKQWFFKVGRDTSDLTLVVAVRAWAELDGDDLRTLAELNDGIEADLDARGLGGVGFRRIATFIREYL